LSVLLTGATGRLGAEVVRALAARGVGGRAVVRDPARAAPLAALGFVPVAGDLDHPRTLAPCLEGVDVVLLLTADHPRLPERELALLSAARARGVERIVKVSAHAAGLGSDGVSFGRLHRASERALAATGITASVLRPMFFMQSLLLFAPAVRRGALVAPTGYGRVAMVDLRDVADAVAVAVASTTCDGRVRVLTGPRAVSFAEVASILGAATGRRVRHISPPAIVARLALPAAAGVSRWEAARIAELFEAQRGGAQSAATSDLEALLARSPRDLGAFAEEYAQSFSGTGATPLRERQ
jgi:uncharacterized protein YbjT (DUF2867 family)